MRYCDFQMGLEERANFGLSLGADLLQDKFNLLATSDRDEEELTLHPVYFIRRLL
jgi:hypothetical protein